MAAEKSEIGNPDAGRDFVITRVFVAPRDLVWKAWTEPERIKQWFGPKGVTMPFCKMDFRVGGTLHYCMRTPDGQDMWGKQVFREIAPPERIVVIHSFADEAGNAAHHPMAPSWPLEMLSTATFAEQGGKTELTIRWSPYNASAEELRTFDEGRAGMTQGWSGTFEQLDAYLAKAQT